MTVEASVSAVLARKRTHWGGRGYDLADQKELTEAVAWATAFVDEVLEEIGTE